MALFGPRCWKFWRGKKGEADHVPPAATPSLVDQAPRSPSRPVPLPTMAKFVWWVVKLAATQSNIGPSSCRRLKLATVPSPRGLQVMRKSTNIIYFPKNLGVLIEDRILGLKTTFWGNFGKGSSTRRQSRKRLDMPGHGEKCGTPFVVRTFWPTCRQGVCPWRSRFVPFLGIMGHCR